MYVNIFFSLANMDNSLNDSGQNIILGNLYMGHIHDSISLLNLFQYLQYDTPTIQKNWIDEFSKS